MYEVMRHLPSVSFSVEDNVRLHVSRRSRRDGRVVLRTANLGRRDWPSISKLRPHSSRSANRVLVPRQVLTHVQSQNMCDTK